MSVEDYRVETDVIPQPELQVALAERPKVRGATFEDVSALAGVELTCYPDVYGVDPSDGVRENVERKYRERVELLGDWVRVLQTPEGEVYGTMVCCPTNLSPRDLEKATYDMTDNEVLRRVYKPEGKNGYIFNLAIKRGVGDGNRLDLMADAVQMGAEFGVKRAYFESRLPGLASWIERRASEQKLDSQDPVVIANMAEEYWRTVEVVGDEELPLDGLLKMYVQMGCKPLRLIRDAWKPDISSKSYGVLCAYDLPQQPPTPIKERLKRSAKNVKDWAGNHRVKAVLGATAVAGTVYSFASGSASDILHRAEHRAAWVGSAYTASWCVLLGGLGVAVMGPGYNRLAARFDNLPRWKNAVETGVIINGVGALGAAAVLGAGIVETFPPEAAIPSLGFVAFDAFSSVVARLPVLGRFHRNTANH